MQEFQIFSDSSCDLPDEFITKYNIELIPFYVTFDQDTYYKEREEIDRVDFYQTLINKKIFPKTSLPSVQDYTNKFKTFLSKGIDVLCLCINQRFSGSYQSAMNAKLILQDKYPNNKIFIIDSTQATASQGLLLLQMAYMKEAGFTLEECVNGLERIKPTARIMFTLETLDYLAKGGRIGRVISLAGDILNLRPLIQLKDTELIPYCKVRGRRKSLDKILYMVEEYFKENNERYEDYEFCLANASTYEETAAVQKRVEELIGRTIDYPVFQIGVTVGTYTGPGALGVCFVKKYTAKA